MFTYLSKTYGTYMAHISLGKFYYILVIFSSFYHLLGASSREKQNDEECINSLIFENPETTSNARITCKVARLSLESLNPSLQDYGSAIIYNIATRDVRVSIGTDEESRTRVFLVMGVPDAYHWDGRGYYFIDTSVDTFISLSGDAAPSQHRRNINYQ